MLNIAGYAPEYPSDLEVQHVLLLGGHEKKGRKAERSAGVSDASDRVREVFLAGRFPVVTTHQVEGRRIAKVLGLVCCRGFDSDEAFLGMAARAMNKGAQAIVGYNENVAFHPDGSKYFSCFGTAVMFEFDPTDPEIAAAHAATEVQGSGTIWPQRNYLSKPEYHTGKGLRSY